MVNDNTFRSDLYFRLNVLNVPLPPLRERGCDISLLAETFFHTHARKLGRSLNIADEVTDALLHYSWPGNIRELRNVIEHAVSMSEDGKITISHLPNWLVTSEELLQRKMMSLGDRVREFERKTIISMLKKYGADIEAKRRIATELGISLATLYNKIKETDAENK
jgi:transcriptional regulator with PAS, ATPase and Fis domain